jgi:hypothetical protein
MKRPFVLAFFALLLIMSATEVFGAYPHRRIGLRQDAILPCNNQMEVKSAIYYYGLEVDAIKDPRLDVGLRFGYAGFSSNTTTYNANYDMAQAGLGLRYFFDEREEIVKTFHSFKRYFLLDGLCYLASRYQSITAVSPSILTGLGVKAGLGAEYIFGPHSNGFLEASGLLTDIRSSDNAYTIPLSGFVLAFGVRIEP